MSDDIVSKNGEVVGQWNGESVEDLKKSTSKYKTRTLGSKVKRR